MMMMGRGAAASIHAPPWMLDDAADGLPYSIPLSGICGGDWLGDAALTALQRYLPSNESAYADSDDGDLEAPVDAYACDEFRIYEFKVRRCARGRSHDWTECPYAHLGEKARRRDPRKFHYSGTACPDFRKGNCKRGDACEFAHGVFECWLHPTRYRTQPCKDGTSCRRRVCFFAHTPEQLRVLPQQQSPRSSSCVALESYDGSPMRRLALEDYFPKNLVASPTDQSPVESPPVSPSGEALRRASWPVAGSTMNDVVASLRQLQLSKVKPAWGVFGSPRAGICSQPSTPTRLGGSRGWVEEEPVERVESGRALRAKMFERLSRESVMEKKPEAAAASASPDVDWISELVK